MALGTCALQMEPEVKYPDQSIKGLNEAYIVENEKKHKLRFM